MKVIYNNGAVDQCPEAEELEVLRHSAAHIMAGAVKRLYPHAKFAYGPATEKGFYYDVDLGDVKLVDADLEAIEAEMKKIVKENLPIKPEILPRDEAMAVTDSLKAAGIKVSSDDRNEKMGYRIREAQLEKIPYMLIIGDKGVETNTVSVRKRGGVDLGSMTLDEFIAKAKAEIETLHIDR